MGIRNCLRSLQRISQALILCGVFVTGSVRAEAEVALALGFRSDNFDSALAGTSASGKSNFQGGALTSFPISSAFAFRTGMLYSVKASSLEDGSGYSLSNDFSYLDIPVTGMWKLADYGGFYFGPLLSVNISKSSSLVRGNSATSPLLAAVDSSGKAKDVSGMNTGFVLGFQFKFYPQLGGQIYFETFPGALSAGLKSSRTVGIDLLVYFE